MALTERSVDNHGQQHSGQGQAAVSSKGRNFQMSNRLKANNMAGKDARATNQSVHLPNGARKMKVNDSVKRKKAEVSDFSKNFNTISPKQLKSVKQMQPPGLPG